MTRLDLLFPGNEVAALLYEQELDRLGAAVVLVAAEFPGGLPPWFVHPGTGDARERAEAERQMRALGKAESALVPFLPPPESVTVSVRVRADGTVVSASAGSVRAALVEAIRRAAD
jgi:hypothetical protein